ncbi:MAG: hypothetical protein ABSE50_02295 [Xanthobacteraceae bacterium]|jgi:hypothetical protein
MAVATIATDAAASNLAMRIGAFLLEFQFWFQDWRPCSFIHPPEEQRSRSPLVVGTHQIFFVANGPRRLSDGELDFKGCICK